VTNFLIGLLIKAAQNQKVQDAISDFVGKLITEKILPLLPLMAAAAADAIVDMIPGAEHVENLDNIVDKIREDLHNKVPDVDFGIPALDNALDWWRPRQ
jgi:hypothetical protein